MSTPLSIEVKLAAPSVLTRGEPVIVNVQVCNRGTEGVKVSARLNLFESDLRIHVNTPTGERLVLEGTHLKDSAPNRILLASGECVESPIQIHYTNRGFVFAEPGEYTLHADYDPGSGESLASEPVVVSIRAESSNEERDRAKLTLAAPFGRALASGEVAGDAEAAANLKTVAQKYAQSLAGRAARLVLANAAEEKTDAAEAALQSCSDATSDAETSRLALAVAPPGHTPHAPLIQALAKRLAGTAAPAVRHLARMLAAKRERRS